MVSNTFESLPWDQEFYKVEVYAPPQANSINKRHCKWYLPNKKWKEREKSKAEQSNEQ